MSTSSCPPDSICWARLTNPRGHAQNVIFWQDINKCAHRLVSSPKVLLAVQRLLVVTREEFKALSHQGAVYMGKGRYRDAGNWTYSVVYQFMCETASGTELEPILSSLMGLYTSLEASAPYTYTTLSMQGDVVETILELCRYTGPSVPKHDIEELVAVNKAIKTMCNAINGLRRVISNFEQVPDSEFMAPEVFAKTVRSILEV